MEQAIKNREELTEIKMALAIGDISYDEARKLASPILDRINSKGKEIAKKYNKKYHAISFIEVMR